MHFEKHCEQLYPRLKSRNIRHLYQVKMPCLRDSSKNSHDSSSSNHNAIVVEQCHKQFPQRIHTRTNNPKPKKLSPLKLYYQPELVSKQWRLPQLQTNPDSSLLIDQSVEHVKNCQHYLRTIDFEYSPIVQSPRYCSETKPTQLMVSAQKKQLNAVKKEHKQKVPKQHKKICVPDEPKKSWSAINFKKYTHDITQFDQDLSTPDHDQDLFNYVNTLYKK